MNFAENYRRTVLFECPERIPMTFAYGASSWLKYDQNQLCDLIEGHPLLFPDFQRPKLPVVPELPLNARATSPYIDPWQCVWETECDGLIGVVRKHPLADWSSFDNYEMPDPDRTDGTYPLDMDMKRRYVEDCRRNGSLAGTSINAFFDRNPVCFNLKISK